MTIGDDGNQDLGDDFVQVDQHPSQRLTSPLEQTGG